LRKTVPDTFSGPEATHRYLWGPAVDQLLADEAVSGEVTWPLTDHLGTIRDWAAYDDVLDETTIVNHILYDAFGRITEETNPTDHLFYFTARPLEKETNLQNNLNRWYEAPTGKWLSEDPIGFDAGDGNLYRYVDNRPAIAPDPIGLQGGQVIGLDGDPNMGGSTPLDLEPIREDIGEVWRVLHRSTSADAWRARQQNWESSLSKRVNQMSLFDVLDEWREGGLPPVVVLDATSPLTQEVLHHEFLVQLQNDLLDRAMNDALQGKLKSTYFDQRKYKHPATPGQFVDDISNIVVSDSVLSFVGSYWARAEMHVSKAPEAGNYLMFDATIYYEVMDAKNKKSGALPPKKMSAKDAQYIENELRPFHRESNVDLYFRWKEHLKFKIMVSSDGTHSVEIYKGPNYILGSNQTWTMDGRKPHYENRLSQIGDRGPSYMESDELTRPPDNYDNTNAPSYYQYTLQAAPLRDDAVRPRPDPLGGLMDNPDFRRAYEFQSERYRKYGF